MFTVMTLSKLLLCSSCCCCYVFWLLRTPYLAMLLLLGSVVGLSSLCADQTL